MYSSFKNVNLKKNIKQIIVQVTIDRKYYSRNILNGFSKLILSHETFGHKTDCFTHKIDSHGQNLYLQKYYVYHRILLFSPNEYNESLIHSLNRPTLKT